MEEILGEEAEEESTKDGNKCPHCSARYSANPRKCEHLLCEVFYVESNNEFVAAPNCSIVANLFGIEVPRVIAMRFIRLMREKRPPDIGHATSGVLTTIKYSTETREEFLEWTYFIVEHPHIYMVAFEDFVLNTYCEPQQPRNRIAFSQLQFRNGVVVLNGDSIVVNDNHLGWIMLAGLPDTLPVFLYPVETNESVIYVGRSETIYSRIETWPALPDSCVVNHLATLPTYLVN